VRHLEQDAGAITGAGVTSAGAAVLQVDEDFQRLLDDLVSSTPIDVRDNAYTTRVVLMRRVVQPTLGSTSEVRECAGMVGDVFGVCHETRLSLPRGVESIPAMWVLSGW
jgi:hypothetical protein